MKKVDWLFILILIMVFSIALPILIYEYAQILGMVPHNPIILPLEFIAVGLLSSLFYLYDRSMMGFLGGVSFFGLCVFLLMLEFKQEHLMVHVMTREFVLGSMILLIAFTLILIVINWYYNPKVKVKVIEVDILKEN